MTIRAREREHTYRKIKNLYILVSLGGISPVFE